MSRIVLSTLNSRYSHASLALRYLFANLGELQAQTRLLEFTISQEALLIAQKIHEQNPQIVGLGVYIWNTVQTLEVIKELRTLNPGVKIVLGGPEVSYESEGQEICALADHVVQGEADFAFRDLCRKIISGVAAEKFIHAETPAIDQLQSPYSYYNDEDVGQRLIYVEASRGCPYVCEFCLSSLDQSVRNFPLEPFFTDLQRLIDRGVRQFKFIDRTFNLSPKTSLAILTFFLERVHLGLFLHFEMVPDRLPEDLKKIIAQFPAKSLQFEIGVQTWNTEVASLISRRQNYAKTEDNLRWLVKETGVHVHADLIAGLPGEDEISFAKGFDRLLDLKPHEIQVGILKRLKGTPIIRHDREWGMVYKAKPPFAVQETRTMNAETVARIACFAKFWDRLANSGEFPRTLDLFTTTHDHSSAYSFFMHLSRYLFGRFERTHSIDLLDLVRTLQDYGEEVLKIDATVLRQALAEDYQDGGRRSLPEFLSNGASTSHIHRQADPIQTPPSHLPKRQRRHLLQV